MARVLVVDDEPEIRQVMRVILESEGHEVVEADDGLSAFEQVRAKCPELVLLDVMMPGMDGYELLEKLLHVPEFAAPVIMVTVRSDGDGPAREAGAGAVDHLRKPFTMDEVRRTVRHMLETSPEDIETRRGMLRRAAATYAEMTSLRSLVSEAGDTVADRHRLRRGH